MTRTKTTKKKQYPNPMSLKWAPQLNIPKHFNPSFLKDKAFNKSMHIIIFMQMTYGKVDNHKINYFMPFLMSLLLASEMQVIRILLYCTPLYKVALKRIIAWIGPTCNK